MSAEESYQCDPRLVHCLLNGQSECECGAERHDHVLAETFALAWGILVPGLGVMLLQSVGAYGQVGARGAASIV